MIFAAVHIFNIGIIKVLGGHSLAARLAYPQNEVRGPYVLFYIN